MNLRYVIATAHCISNISLGSFWFLLFRNTEFSNRYRAREMRYYINFSCGHLTARLTIDEKNDAFEKRKILL